jgi:hypothetical protein
MKDAKWKQKYESDYPMFWDKKEDPFSKFGEPKTSFLEDLLFLEKFHFGCLQTKKKEC